jgi:small-conductance mechanosensitive channel
MLSLLNPAVVAMPGQSFISNSTLLTAMFPHLLADFSSIPWVALVAIIGSFLIGPIVIFVVFRFAHRRHELWHETARVALEKGQPLPPLPDDMQPKQPPPACAEKANDLRSGLVLIAVGAGLYLFLGSLAGRSLGLVGAIPGFIGVALLLNALLSATFRRKDTPPTTLPPQT